MTDKGPNHPDNLNRVEWAEAALDAFASRTTNKTSFRDLHPGDQQDQLGDLLCDLMHFARHRRLDFAAAIKSGTFHYDHETQPDYAGLSMAPDLASYDRILVAFSGGKDCLAALLLLIDMGVDPSKIELHHHEVDGAAHDFMDWTCTPAYCRAIAHAFNLPIYFSGKEGGFDGEMMRDGQPTGRTFFDTPEGVRRFVGGNGPPGRRMKFPQVSADLSVRWCSAYLKIDVMDRLICNQPRFLEGRTLVVTGERAQESPSRARYAMFEPHRADSRDGSRKPRYVDHWRPVHQWHEGRVWDELACWSVVPHVAYQLGWSRLSCLSCIFGSPNQWATIAAVFPERFELIAAREAALGVTIQRKATVRELAARGTPYPAALARPDLVARATLTHWTAPVIVAPAAWELPAGAYGEDAGPT